MNEVAALQSINVTAIEPKVILDVIEAERRKKAVLANLCKVDRTLARTKGREVHIPQRGILSAVEVAEGEDITGKVVGDVTFSTVIVRPRKIGTWFKVTEEQIAATEIDIVNEMIKDAGAAIANKEDDMVAAELMDLTGKEVVAPSGSSVTFEDLIAAKTRVAVNKYNANCVVLSPLRADQLVADSTRFVAVETIGRQAVVEGAIGRYAGLDVVPSAAISDNKVIVFDREAAPWLVLRRDVDLKREEKPATDSHNFYVFKEEAVKITEPKGFAVITYA